MNFISFFQSILLAVPLLISNVSLQHPAPTTIEKSRVEFSIVNAGVEVTGTLDQLEAEITLDPKQLDKSSIGAKVSAATIDTGIAIRDKHLRKADYFHTEKYPEIVMRSTQLSGGPNRFNGKFDLTIKNITKQVDIPFRRIQKHGVTHYQGRFEINRLDFDLGEKSLILSDVVTVTIDLDVK